MSQLNRGTPSLTTFSPERIKFQKKVIWDIDVEFDYNLGVHELLLSGAVGSSKSALAAHCTVKHCLMHPRSRVAICRRALPDVKKTIFAMILEHLECDELVEGVDYFVQRASGSIQFRNKSEILSLFWADGKYSRIRSINLSAAVIEELTENQGKDWQAFNELKARIGRLPIKERWLMCCTNPDSPAHPAYKYFIETKGIPTRHVYYSKTRDNPYLDASYIEGLERDMDPKLAQRLLYGQWVEIDKERIYYQYSDKNRIHKQYDRTTEPIILSFDFNIGEGKPFSSCALQYSNDTFHVFDQVVIEGARTLDAMEEWYEKGYFSGSHKIIIHGDASGESKSTRSIMSDYDIIKKFLSNIPNLDFRIEVQRANYPIRARHNRVNAYCLNMNNQVRLYVYDGASKVDEALRLTSLRKGGNYVEDDSKDFQHVGTALGYAIMYETNRPKTRADAQRIR